MTDPAHEVHVLCDCGDIEHCRMELYVSDVRIAYRDCREALLGARCELPEGHSGSHKASWALQVANEVREQCRPEVLA